MRKTREKGVWRSNDDMLVAYREGGQWIIGQWTDKFRCYETFAFGDWWKVKAMMKDQDTLTKGENNA